MITETKNTISKFTIEQLFVGQKEKINKIISAQDIINFSSLTDDYHPLHTSDTYAEQHGFDGVIAHGLLLSSFSSALIGMKLPGENAIVIKQCFEYHLPVYVGDNLIIIGTIKGVQKRFNFIEVAIEIIRNDKLVCSGTYQIKIRK